MRSMKILAAAACLTMSAVATADAQPRPFRDAWFWGVHGGLTSYSGSSSTDAAVSSSSVAPQLGLDWLITRQRGGLYVSFNQAFLTATGSVINGPTSADTGFRFVDVKNLRRFNLAAMAFPGDFVRLHPYVGGGFAFGYLGEAQPQFGITDTDRQAEFAASAVNDTKAGIGPLFIAGAQYRMRGLSVFGQFTAAAMSRDFMLAFGNPVSMSTEFGVRYNIGSSISKDY
jgi:opacity protein-like surface antigen